MSHPKLFPRTGIWPGSPARERLRLLVDYLRGPLEGPRRLRELGGAEHGGWSWGSLPAGNLYPTPGDRSSNLVFGVGATHLGQCWPQTYFILTDVQTPQCPLVAAQR